MQVLSEIFNSTLPNWLQTMCMILTTIIAYKTLVISLPKITKKLDKITDRFTRRKYDFCENCPYNTVCFSLYVEDVGDFDKKDEIENPAVSEGIIELYNEIKQYHFGNLQFKYVGTKEHQDCLLHKLTLAINLIGSANMSFNKVKAENQYSTKGKAHGE